MAATNESSSETHSSPDCRGTSPTNVACFSRPSMVNLEPPIKTEEANAAPNRDISLFNDALQSYLALQREITEMEGELRIRKGKMRELSATLMSYIKIHNIKDIKLDGEYRGTTLTPVYNKTVSFDKAIIISTLQQYFSENLDEFEKIMALISENANVRETSKLAMKKPKKVTSKSRYDSDLEKVDALLADDAISNAGVNADE